MAVREPSVDELTHLYLGITYQQLGRWDDAIAAFRRGLAGSIQYRHLFLFNIANSFFAQGRNSFALESYDQALAARTDYAPAYLNRANARMKAADYAGAVADYSVYLTLDPASSQAPTIRQLLDLLGQKAADRGSAEGDGGSAKAGGGSGSKGHAGRGGPVPPGGRGIHDEPVGRLRRPAGLRGRTFPGRLRLLPRVRAVTRGTPKTDRMKQ